MVLVSVRADDEMRLGVRTEGGIVDVQSALEDLPRSGGQPIARELHAMLSGGKPARRDLQAYVESAIESRPEAGWLLQESDIELGPCLPAPGKIICIGLNYRKHAEEAGMEIPNEPILFSKLSNTVAASGEPIPLLRSAEQYDYEAELGVIIGERAKGVPETEALDYVFGYCNANDLSARD